MVIYFKKIDIKGILGTSFMFLAFAVQVLTQGGSSFDVETFILVPANYIWDRVFKNGPSKICGRQPLKNLT